MASTGMAMPWLAVGYGVGLALLLGAAWFATRCQWHGVLAAVAAWLMMLSFCWWCWAVSRVSPPGLPTGWQMGNVAFFGGVPALLTGMVLMAGAGWLREARANERRR